jgi:hypothetical protein
MVYEASIDAFNYMNFVGIIAYNLSQSFRLLKVTLSATNTKPMLVDYAFILLGRECIMLVYFSSDTLHCRPLLPILLLVPRFGWRTQM